MIIQLEKDIDAKQKKAIIREINSLKYEVNEVRT